MSLTGFLVKNGIDEFLDRAANFARLNLNLDYLDLSHRESGGSCILEGKKESKTLRRHATAA